jgi:hypothetical protein
MALTYPSLFDDDPTIGWQMVREGINDYKYARVTLRGACGSVRVSGRVGAVARNL